VTGVITIPPRLMKVMRFDWRIDWRSFQPGETTAGLTSVAHQGFPRWVGTLALFHHNQEVREWRAVQAAARGMVGVWEVEMIDPLTFCPAQISASLAANGVPFATGVPFAGGAGFSFEPFVTCIGGAAAGASSLHMRVVSGYPAPLAGQLMSHDYWPFMVTSVTPFGGDDYSVTIEPPLRRAIPPGGRIALRARGRFRLVGDREGAGQYGPARIQRVQAQFVEVLDRA